MPSDMLLNYKTSKKTSTEQIQHPHRRKDTLVVQKLKILWHENKEKFEELWINNIKNNKKQIYLPISYTVLVQVNNILQFYLI